MSRRLCRPLAFPLIVVGTESWVAGGRSWSAAAPSSATSLWSNACSPSTGCSGTRSRRPRVPWDTRGAAWLRPGRRHPQPASQRAANLTARATSWCGRTPPRSSSIDVAGPAGGPLPDGAPISGLGRAAADLRQGGCRHRRPHRHPRPWRYTKQLRRALSNATEEPINLTPWVTAEAIDGLKFSRFLPSRAGRPGGSRRLADPESIARALDGRLIGCAIQADDVFGVIDFPSRGLLKQTLLALREAHTWPSRTLLGSDAPVLQAGAAGDK